MDSMKIDNKMTVIITMAGAGSRFKKAGYQCPKYMINAKGKTLFEWSMDSLLGYNDFVSKYIFVVRKEDKACQFIETQCRKYGVAFDIVEIDRPTDGQATTCMLALTYCDPNSQIMIYNIDTYVEPWQLRYEDISGDGYLPCFHEVGDHWSFVRLDDRGKAVEVREKKRISDNCTLGAYYFASASLFKKIYNEYYNNNSNLEKNERYIAPLYNLMISKGMTVRIGIIDARRVHVLGTPEELDVFLNTKP